MPRTPKVHAEQAKRFRQVSLASSSPIRGRFTAFLGPPQLQTPDTLFVRFQNFNLEAAKTQALARTGHAAFVRDYQPGNRREIVGFDFHLEQAFDFSNLSAAQHFVNAAPGRHDLFRRFTADVFVFDFTDGLFQDVFDGHQARDAAVLVYDDRQIRVRLLRFYQQPGQRFCLRNEIDRTYKRRYRTVGFVVVPAMQQVAHINKTLDVVDLIAKDRQP